MSDLTDLEICTEIAKIEGYKTCAFEGYECCAYAGTECDKISCFTHIPYNPLTDDALCFRLMVSHKVYIDYFGKQARAAMKHDDEYNEFEVDVIDMSMNRAICLAIIESNNEK